MKSGTLLAILFLSLIAILQLLRLILQVPIIAGGVTIPVWLSFFGFLLPATIAFLLWRENRK